MDPNDQWYMSEEDRIMGQAEQDRWNPEALDLMPISLVDQEGVGVGPGGPSGLA